MKRSECTVEKLKELGYKARYVQDSWFGGIKVYDCNERHTQEVFEIVVDVVRNGGRIDIQRNEINYTVKVFVEALNFGERHMRYFLVRPMTEAERFETDIESGRGKDWDVVERQKG